MEDGYTNEINKTTMLNLLIYSDKANFHVHIIHAFIGDSPIMNTIMFVAHSKYYL